MLAAIASAIWLFTPAESPHQNKILQAQFDQLQGINTVRTPNNPDLKRMQSVVATKN
jgi:hypothetical protein